MDNQQKGFWKRTGEALGFTSPEAAQTRAVDGPAAGVVPPAPTSNAWVSVDTALSISAVYRSVSIITASVSQMDLGVFRDGIEIKTPTIIKTPNIDQSQRQFIKETVWSLATHGQAFWLTYGDPVVNIEVLDPSTVTVVKENGRIKYWIGTTEVPARRIKHLRLMSKPGEVKGHGPIQYGQSELYGALRLRDFADHWFASSGVPVGVLTTDQVLNAEQAKAFADAWKTFLAANGTAVLSQGMRYEHLNIKPADAQYLEVQQSKTIAIARLFGVPPTLLASGSEGNSNTYTNQQELWIQFLQTTLVDYMNEVEDALSSLLPRGQVVNFKEETLLRMNTQMETEVSVAQVNAGLVTPNEWRASKGLPPIVSSPNTNEGSESDGGN